MKFQIREAIPLVIGVNRVTVFTALSKHANVPIVPWPLRLYDVCQINRTSVRATNGGYCHNVSGNAGLGDCSSVALDNHFACPGSHLRGNIAHWTSGQSDQAAWLGGRQHAVISLGDMKKPGTEKTLLDPDRGHQRVPCRKGRGSHFSASRPCVQSVWGMDAIPIVKPRSKLKVPVSRMSPIRTSQLQPRSSVPRLSA